MELLLLDYFSKISKNFFNTTSNWNIPVSIFDLPSVFMDKSLDSANNRELSALQSTYSDYIHWRNEVNSSHQSQSNNALWLDKFEKENQYGKILSGHKEKVFRYLRFSQALPNIVPRYVCTSM